MNPASCIIGRVGTLILYEHAVRKPRPSVTRVLLFLDQYLLASAVESILTREADLTICSHMPSVGNPILAEIERFRPDVIITDATRLMQASLGLLDLLRSPLEVKILIVGDDENLVLALEKKEILIQGSHDLIQAIRSN